MVPSIFFYVARDLITRVFYAHQDSTTPYHVAMLAIVVKAILDWSLVGPLGVGGISLATTLITIFNLSLLAFFLKKKIGNLGFTKLTRPLAVMLTASTACGATAYLLQHYLAAHMPSTSFIYLASSLAISCLSGLLAYGVICLVLKLEEPLALIKRSPLSRFMP